MPIIIDELELALEPSGVPDTGTGGDQAALTPTGPDEQELLGLLDLIDERRARLVVD